MLASLKLGADFSRGCADWEISHLLLATHPHHRFEMIDPLPTGTFARNCRGSG
jgi:hypothetical protein